MQGRSRPDEPVGQLNCMLAYGRTSTTSAGIRKISCARCGRQPGQRVLHPRQARQAESIHSELIAGLRRDDPKCQHGLLLEVDHWRITAHCHKSRHYKGDDNTVTGRRAALLLFSRCGALANFTQCPLPLSRREHRLAHQDQHCQFTNNQLNVGASRCELLIARVWRARA